ncbi:Fe(3+) ABC transporter substrate-binding protein [bacterium]|nr:Fe(3+) ABC transporter substrate-binding protein [bacterium]
MIIALILFLLVAGMFGPAKASDLKGEVNVYSHRHYDTDKLLFKKFSKQTGIRVNVVKASADQLLKRLEIEGTNSPADVLVTVDAGRLYRAREKNLLQPVQSEVLARNVPTHIRHPKGYWFGLTIRARVVVYSKKKVQPAELDSYESLAEPKWKGRVLVRSSQNIYNQSLLASIIAAEGSEAAKRWAKGLVANMARSPKGNDRDQMKAIVAGVGDVALVNTYYVGRMLTSGNAQEREVAKQLGVFFPNQNDRGAHVNVSGAGVTKHAKNPEHAIKFLEFLSSIEAQKLFAEANFEYPVNPKVSPAPLVKAWGDFKAHEVNMSLLGKYNREAVKIFDQVGWK